MMDTPSTDLEQKVLHWLTENSRNGQVPSNEVLPTTNLLEAGILDSLSFIDLLAYLEEETQQSVDLTDLEPAEFSTVRGLCAHMAKSS